MSLPWKAWTPPGLPPCMALTLRNAALSLLALLLCVVPYPAAVVASGSCGVVSQVVVTQNEGTLAGRDPFVLVHNNGTLFIGTEVGGV